MENAHAVVMTTSELDSLDWNLGGECLKEVLSTIFI
jgi:hypothetical protein